MANAFKQKQEQARQDKLLQQCRNLASVGGAASLARAITTYAKSAGITKVQAEQILVSR